MSKTVLVVSYFAKRNGCCPAEWLDDKTDSLIKLGYKVILVSSLWSDKYEHPQVVHYRVPSLSPKDFKDEVKEILEKRNLPLSTYFWIPAIIIFGIPLDVIQYFLTNGLGGGKWSWTISSFLTSFYLMCSQRIELIFTTGGPASAHLAGVLIGKIFRKKIVAELQDPLSGEGIGRNSRSAKMLYWIEQILIKNCNKVVYVTRSAAEEAKEKFNNSPNISFLYPGSKKISVTEVPKRYDNKLTLVHLGTLYSTRNLDTLIVAIEKLITENKISENDIQIINLGDIYGDYREGYLKKSYIEQLPILPREKAIEFASSCDVSLLIQHNDPRSSTTIPYKTYDYLNIGNPVFGLTNSLELSSLLSDRGHFFARVSKPDEIAEKLYELYLHRSKKIDLNLQGIDAITQTKKLIEL